MMYQVHVSQMQAKEIDYTLLTSPPVVSPDVDDLTTVLASRLREHPAFATELVSFFDQDAAMRHRHEEGREEIRRQYQAIEAQRIEQVRLDTAVELTVATQQHEDSCRQERENFKCSFKASLVSGSSFDLRGGLGAETTNAINQSQGLGDSTGDLEQDSVLQHHFYDTRRVSDINFPDSDYGSNEIWCPKCYMILDADGICIGCQILQSN